MKRNQLIIFIFLLTVPLVKSFATGQEPDRLIYKGDTLHLFSNPLEQLYKDASLRPAFFGDKEACFTTACWRRYIAEWTMIDEQLYLTGIFSCCFSEDGIKADLTHLFGDKCVDGKVKVDWYTGDLIAPQGKLLFYVHDGYESIYETELEFQFKSGQLIGTKTYDNSKARKSIYSQDDKLREFIYANINWTKLPELEDKVIRIVFTFSANENGVIDSIKLIRGYDSSFDEEGIRVVKAIPDWDVYYRREKHKRISWTLPIVFSNDNRKKYSK